MKKPRKMSPQSSSCQIESSGMAPLLQSKRTLFLDVQPSQKHEKAEGPSTLKKRQQFVPSIHKNKEKPHTRDLKPPSQSAAALKKAQLLKSICTFSAWVGRKPAGLGPVSCGAGNVKPPEGAPAPPQSKKTLSSKSLKMYITCVFHRNP